MINNKLIRNLIYIVSYLIILFGFNYFQGTIFIDGMFTQFSSVMLVSFVLYYYIDSANNLKNELKY